MYIIEFSKRKNLFYTVNNEVYEFEKLVVSDFFMTAHYVSSKFYELKQDREYEKLLIWRIQKISNWYVQKPVFCRIELLDVDSIE